MANEVNQAKMLCPYCEAVFTPEMEVDYYAISDGCVTCGQRASITVELSCASCHRVIYKKEVEK